MVVLGQVRVQPHLVGAGQLGRGAHQVLAHAEGRARCHGHVRHGAKAGVVPGFNQALGFFQNERLFFHHAVGWQAALRLAHAHAASCGGKAHAYGVGGFNAVVQPHPVGVDVQVVAAGGAATQQQLGHGHLGGDLHHLGREPRPYGVKPLQPTEQLGVLHLWHGPRERLVPVVMRVDQARHHHVLARVNHFIHRTGGQPGVHRFVGLEDAVNAPIAYQQRGVVKFGVGIVK